MISNFTLWKHLVFKILSDKLLNLMVNLISSKSRWHFCLITRQIVNGSRMEIIYKELSWLKDTKERTTKTGWYSGPWETLSSHGYVSNKIWNIEILLYIYIYISMEYFLLYIFYVYINLWTGSFTSLRIWHLWGSKIYG